MLLVLFLSILSLVSCAERNRNRKTQAVEIIEHLENGNNAAAVALVSSVLALPAEERFTAADFITLPGIYKYLDWFSRFVRLQLRNKPELRLALSSRLESNVLGPVFASNRQDLKDKWSLYKAQDENTIKITYHAFELLREMNIPSTETDEELDISVFANKIHEHKALIRAVYRNPGKVNLWVLLPQDPLNATVNTLCKSTIASLKETDMVARIGNDTTIAPMTRREFMLFMWKQLLNPKLMLFIDLPEAQFKFAPNPAMTKILLGDNAFAKEQKRKYYIAVGRLLAMAILHDEVLPFEFVSAFYKTLHRSPVTLEDMKDLDEDVFRQLTQLKANPNMAPDLDLFFAVTKPVPGGHEDIPLIQNGDNEPVTPRNCGHYIDRYVAFECYEQVKPQMDCICEGFDFLISLKDFKQKFNWRELSALLTKHVPINVADWRAHTEVKHATPAHLALVDILFNFLADERSIHVNNGPIITADEKRSLILYFWTKMRRTPQNGFKDIKLTISCMDESGPLMVRSCAKMILLKRTTHEALLETLKTIIIQYSSGAVQ